MGIVKLSIQVRMQRMRLVLMAPFTRLLNALMSILQKGVGFILSFVEAGMKMYDWAMKMMEKIPFVGGAIKEINKANGRLSLWLRKRLLLRNNHVRTRLWNAKAALEVSKYRTLAKDKEKYTAQERLKFVKEANKLEDETVNVTLSWPERKAESIADRE